MRPPALAEEASKLVDCAVVFPLIWQTSATRTLHDNGGTGIASTTPSDGARNLQPSGRTEAQAASQVGIHLLSLSASTLPSGVSSTSTERTHSASRVGPLTP